MGFCAAFRSRLLTKGATERGGGGGGGVGAETLPKSGGGVGMLVEAGQGGGGVLNDFYLNGPLASTIFCISKIF